jgi:polysaccharide deacetylase family protein (PEP-CTERM system associated)
VTEIINRMTVDVEDYFHATAFDRSLSRSSWTQRESRVERNTMRLLEFFHQHRVRGTFFVLGWVAERYPTLVRSIAASGHEIASHGFHHQLVYTLTVDQFREDVRRAKRTIEDAFGGIVRGYRAPSFSMVESSLWALDVLVEEGHTYDASVFPIYHDRYGIPDAPRRTHTIRRPAGTIVEVPASTIRLRGTNLPIAGGGYFRLFPYPFTRWAMRRVNAEGEPVTFYIHPWEIDPDQPRLPISPLVAMRHYTKIGDTLNRLQRLVADFSFDGIDATLDARTPLPVSAEAKWAHAK